MDLTSLTLDVSMDTILVIERDYLLKVAPEPSLPSSFFNKIIFIKIFSFKGGTLYFSILLY